MTRRKVGALTLLAALGAWTDARAQAGAPRVWVEAEAEVGAPRQPQPVRMVEAREGVELQVAATHVRLPWTGVTSAAVESVPVSADTAVLHVTAASPSDSFAALLGGPKGTTLLWQGSVELRGDPGERTGEALQVEPRGEQLAVRVGQRFEALRDCTGAPILLRAREVDPETLRLGDPNDDGAPLDTAVRVRPREALTPVSPLGTLRVVAATDEKAAGVRTGHPAVLDDDPATGLLARARRTPQYMRLTLATTGFPVRRIEVGAPAAPATLPPTLTLDLGQGPVRVSLDPEARVQSIELPAPVETSCLGVALTGPIPAGRTYGVGELRAVTELDEGDAAALLARALSQDTAAAAEAPRLLTRLGADGARATLTAWPLLDTRGRRRALPVLARYLGEPPALAAVVEAARDEALREQAMDALAQSDGAGRDALIKLANEPGETGVLAVERLGNIPGTSEALLHLLAEPGGADRPELRAALGREARIDPQRLSLAAEGFRAAASAPALASLALAVAGKGPRMTPVAEEACAQATSAREAPFVPRHRCALAFAALPPAPAPDRWLEHEARAALEWMQRRAAVLALAARQSPAARATAKQALDDPYPRVRATAARALSELSAAAEARAALEARASEDRWPLVRQAAVEALTEVPGAVDALRARVADPSHLVRRAAIAALSQRGDAAAWPVVQRRLDREREYPDVRTAAVRFAAAQCVQAARETLLGQLARGAAEDASPEDGTLAVEALRALRTLGGAAAQEADRWLETNQAPEALGRAAGRPPACGTGTAQVTPTS